MKMQANSPSSSVESWEPDPIFNAVSKLLSLFPIGASMLVGASGTRGS